MLAKEQGILCKFPSLSAPSMPSDVFGYLEDFVSTLPVTTENGWVISEAGTGSGSIAIQRDGADGGYGVLKITSDGTAANDDFELQGPEIVKLESGKQTYFKTRIKIDDTALGEWFVGLSILDTTIIAAGDMTATDAIGFVGGPQDVATDQAKFYVTKNGGGGSNETLGAALTIADDTWYKLEFYFDGDGTVQWRWNDETEGNVATNIPDDEYLAVSFVINSSSTAARHMDIDYIYIAQRIQR